jgi:hypothetical protein
MSSVSLPEIREAEAPPAIAAIYAALNEGIGIGQVNLIWRLPLLAITWAHTLKSRHIGHT